MSILKYVGQGHDECDCCGNTFKWDGDDVIETIHECTDDVKFIQWQVICPHCEESVTVSQ